MSFAQVDAARKLKEKLEGAGKSLVPLLGGNLVDAIWGQSRPAPPDTRLRVHRLEFAGVSVADKLAALRAKLEGERAPLYFTKASVGCIIVVNCLRIGTLTNSLCHLMKRHLRTQPSLLG